MSSPQYYIGLMSGTSLDAIDVALVDISSVHDVALVAFSSLALPSDIKSQLKHLSFEADIQVQTLGETSVQLAHLFSDAINTLLSTRDITADQVIAIGSHGLTIRHNPNTKFPFSLQITDANLLAQLTGIDVISDFRNMDMAVGGQGAPLVPAFHQAMFGSNSKFETSIFDTSTAESSMQDTTKQATRSNHASDNQTTQSKECVVLNLGGIANITVLSSASEILGYDTGPANTLLDSWCEMHTGTPYDENGDWASKGKVVDDLLSVMLTEPYFDLQPPKSTGKELFNLNWLNRQLAAHAVKIGSQINDIPVTPQDIQRTLLELTVVTAATQINKFSQIKTLYICGGGVHNRFLISQLRAQLPGFTIQSTDEVGINSDALEAMAFAWLAYCRVNLISANSPSVTGATKKIIMGSWYSAKTE